VPTCAVVDTTPLIRSFVTHLAELPPPNQGLALQAACRLTASIITTRQFDAVTATLPRPQRKRVRNWRRWAVGSYYWGSLWRCLVTEDDPADWHVWPQDVTYVLENLTGQDRETLQRSKGQVPTRRFSHRRLKRLMTDLNRYCHWLAYSKLSFVSRYDRGMDQEDLQADLLEVGIRTLRRYEHEGDCLKALNFAKRAVHNWAINLITRHTASKRTRLLVHNREEREFQARSVSWEEVGEIVPDTMAVQPLPATLVIRHRLGPLYENWALAVLGHWPEFEEWVTLWGSKDPQRLRPQELNELACRWVGLETKDVEQKVGNLLQEIRA